MAVRAMQAMHVCMVCKENFVGGQTVYLVWAVSTGDLVGAVHFYRQDSDHQACWTRLPSYQQFSYRLEAYEIISGQFIRKG